MSFNESEHPRDKHGKFTDGGQESSDERIKRIREKHFPHLTEEREGDTIRLSDVYIGKSLGAKAKDFVIFDGDKEYKVVEGTHIQNVVAFAGHGCKKPLHFLTLERLMELWRR